MSENVEQLFARHHEEVQGAITRQGDELRAEIEKIGKDVDKLTTLRAGSIAAQGGDGRSHGRDTSGSMKLFAEFARHRSNSPIGLDEYVANHPKADTMSVGSQPDGGFTVLPEVEKSVTTIAHDISPMRQLASVVTISSDAYEVLVDPTLAEINWVGETDSRDDDTDAGQLFKARVPVMEMAAQPRITQSLLDDSFIDIASYLTNKLGTSFALKEGSAFVAGDGVMKPRGFLMYPTSSADDFNAADGSLDRPWGTLGYTPTGSSTPSDAQLADAVVTLCGTLRAPYRPQAKILTSRSFYAKLRTLKDSTGRYLLSTDGRLVDAQPEMICGFGIAPFSEDMPAEGANTYPLAIGDWSSYQIVDRVGIRVLRDPFTNKPFVVFYTTKRVGGAVVNFHGIKLLKIAAS